MHLKRYATLIAVIAVEAAIAQTRQPRIALLMSEKGQHHDEFNSALNTLGWHADRYRCIADDMRKLANSLDDYDMLVAAPLFAPKPPDKQEAMAFLAFVEKGGLIAVTDGSYDCVRTWLAGIDPRFGGLETGPCNSSQWEVKGVTTNAEPPHPLRFFPSRIREPNSWAHFLLPPKDTKWQPVAKCSEGFPVTFAQTVGRGLVSLSALRQPAAKQLGNFYACLQLTRAGIALKSFDLPEPAVGEGKMRLAFDGGTKAKFMFVYEIVSEKGRLQHFEGEVAGAVFELPYRITLRGPVTARLLCKRGGKEIQLFERKTELPQLLTVTPNAYRGILSTARRLPTVTFGIQLTPDREKLAGMTVGLAVFDPFGIRVAETNAVLVSDGTLTYRQPVIWAASPTVGVYTVKAALSSQKGKKLAAAETSVAVLSPRAAQTVIDEDGTFLVNGKPFFPLGFYHVGPADYPKVAALGINTVQFWTWHADTDAYGVSRGLARASEYGLKTIFELNHKDERIFRETARAYGDNPALLMWYGLDEPSEGSYGLAVSLRDTFHAEDANHPVYTVSCRQDVYAEHAQFADVFAIDPYGKPSKASECLPLAVSALKGMKPLVCVPGSFGKETPAEMRATAYLALAYDARGILWYPWSQAGGGPIGVGCMNNPEQQVAISDICAEITALMPALTSTKRWPIASEDGKLRGLFCDLVGQKVVLMVNGTPDKLESEMKFPSVAGVDDANVKIKDFFKKRKDLLDVKKGLVHVTLEPYETRVYCW